MDDLAARAVAEKAAAKRWLRKLRSDAGYTQEELAAIVGVNTRTILNAEKEGSGFPRGYEMLLLLRTLGVVADAPVADAADSLTGRLRELEDALADLWEKNLGTLREISQRLGRIERRLPPEDEQSQEAGGADR